MTPLVAAFSDELTKLALLSPHIDPRPLKLELVRTVLGIDPTMPKPYVGGRLDEAISKLRLQQALSGGGELPGSAELAKEGSSAGFSYITPRTVRRLVAQTGMSEDSPRFQNFAQQLTGKRSLNHMSPLELKLVASMFTGQAL